MRVCVSWFGKLSAWLDGSKQLERGLASILTSSRISTLKVNRSEARSITRKEDARRVHPRRVLNNCLQEASLRFSSSVPGPKNPSAWSKYASAIDGPAGSATNGCVLAATNHSALKAGIFASALIRAVHPEIERLQSLITAQSGKESTSRLTVQYCQSS